MLQVVFLCYPTSMLLDDVKLTIKYESHNDIVQRSPNQISFRPINAKRQNKATDTTSQPSMGPTTVSSSSYLQVATVFCVFTEYIVENTKILKNIHTSPSKREETRLIASFSVWYTWIVANDRCAGVMTDTLMLPDDVNLA